jgi:hypothetical protein
MSDLQARLTAVTQTAAKLVAQMSELNRLREQVRKAQLFQPGNRGGRNVGAGKVLSCGRHLKSTVDLPSASIGRERAAGQA